MNKVLRNLLLILGGCLLLGIMIILFWGVNKGFDISDEGNSMLGYLYPEETAQIRIYQPLVNIFLPFKGNLIQYRGLRIILTLLSSLFFAFGFFRWLKSQKQNKTYSWGFGGIFSVIAIGGMLSYSMGQRILSYNHLILVLLQVTGGLIMLETSMIKLRKKKVLLLILGFAVGLTCFVKFTSFFALLGTLFLFYWIYENPLLSNYKKWIWIGSGVILSFIFFSLTVKPFFTWTQDFWNSLTGQTFGHSPTDLLERYYQTSWRAIWKNWKYHWGIIVAVGALFLIRKAIPKIVSKGVFITIISGLFIYTGYLFYDKTWLLSGDGNKFSASFPFVMLYILLFIGILIHKGERLFNSSFWKRNRELIAIVLLLFLFPFCGSLGTNNALPFHLIKFSFSWFALVLVLTGFFKVPTGPNLLGALFIVFLLLVSTFQTVSGYVFFPYRLEKNLLHQDHRIERLPRGEQILFDSENSKFLSRSWEIIEEKTSFENGGPIIALYDLPGLVYLFGGVSPGHPWYNEVDSKSCFSLKNTSLSSLERTLILKKGNERLGKELKRCMKEVGIEIDSYRQVGAVPFPNENDTLYILSKNN